MLLAYQRCLRDLELSSVTVVRFTMNKVIMTVILFPIVNAHLKVDKVKPPSFFL